jgi:hypothetical protein
MTETERKWDERVRGWRSSGQTAREFAQAHGFSAGGLRHWAYKLKVRASAPDAPAMTNAREGVRIVRVERAAARSWPATLTVEIGAARLRVASGTDPALLRTTLGALFAAIEGGTR